MKKSIFDGLDVIDVPVDNKKTDSMSEKNKWEHLGFVPSKSSDLDLSKYGFTLETKKWTTRMQEFNEVVFITAIPCLTILFVVFIYTIVKIFYNYAKVFEAKSKKKISELVGIEIENSEQNYSE